MNALRGQAEIVAGDRVDQVVQFVGTLTQAVNFHFGQGAGTQISTAVIISPVAEAGERITGSGLPLYTNFNIDFYILSRINRKSYSDDVGRLYDIKDALTWELFDCEGLSQDARDCIASATLVSSIPRILDDPNLIAWAVQWQIKPRVT